MGSVMSAIRDDEYEWGALQINAGIHDCGWKLYSIEWDLARQGFKAGMSGKRLKLFVKQEIETRELSIKHKKELAELAHLEALEQKYK